MNLSDHDMAELTKMFAPLLEWLDVDVYKKNPKVGFNMYMYHNQVCAQDFRGVECERTVCVLGYLWKHYNFDHHNDGSHIIEILIEKFDFENEAMVRNLLERISIVEDGNGNSVVDRLVSIQPYQMAAVIRYFLKTRKLKWKKFFNKDQLTEY